MTSNEGTFQLLLFSCYPRVVAKQKCKICLCNVAISNSLAVCVYHCHRLPFGCFSRWGNGLRADETDLLQDYLLALALRSSNIVMFDVI